MTPVAAAKKRREFTLKTFLSTIDGGRTIATSTKRQRVFVQGDVADAVFYIQKGKVKLTVVSTSGKEATIGILNEGAFFGEGRRIAEFSKKQTIFVQGESSDAIFYIQKGKVKLTVVSKSGKEATIGILNESDFFGKGCLAGQPFDEYK